MNNLNTKFDVELEEYKLKKKEGLGVIEMEDGDLHEKTGYILR